jgi:hypothetical protein
MGVVRDPIISIQPTTYYAGTKRTFGEFDVFTEEPKGFLDPGAWHLEKNNICCLLNAATWKFTKEETE